MATMSLETSSPVSRSRHLSFHVLLFSTRRISLRAPHEEEDDRPLAIKSGREYANHRYQHSNVNSASNAREIQHP
ncbi:hypothetical protein VTO42DRAFT_728 [Malbranchea cinnamomea]